jgi:hypothetical protein
MPATITNYPWLRAPVLDDRGEIRQVRGRTPAPGRSS